MSLSIQVWRPDTCGCVFHQLVERDDVTGETTITYIDEDEAQLLHESLYGEAVQSGKNNVVDPSEKQQRPANVCKSHGRLNHKKDKALFDAVLDENRRKNRSFAEVEEKLLAGEIKHNAVKVTTDRDGRKSLKFEDGYTPGDFLAWEFDPDTRELKVDYPQFSLTDKAKLRAR